MALSQVQTMLLANYYKTYLMRAINFLFFYFGWGLCMQQASEGSGWLGPLVVLAMFAFHLWTVPQKIFEVVYVATVALAGSATDALYLWSGLITYEATPSWMTWWSPPWIIAIWILFAMSVNHSLIWMRDRWWLAVACGSCGACLSYSAGEVLGACVFHQPFYVVMSVIGILWALIMPLSIVYSKWLAAKFYSSHK